MKVECSKKRTRSTRLSDRKRRRRRERRDKTSCLQGKPVGRLVGLEPSRTFPDFCLPKSFLPFSIIITCLFSLSSSPPTNCILLSSPLPPLSPHLQPLSLSGRRIKYLLPVCPQTHYKSSSTQYLLSTIGAAASIYSIALHLPLLLIATTTILISNSRFRSCVSVNCILISLFLFP